MENDEVVMKAGWHERESASFGSCCSECSFGSGVASPTGAVQLQRPLSSRDAGRCRPVRWMVTAAVRGGCHWEGDGGGIKVGARFQRCRLPSPIASFCPFRFLLCLQFLSRPRVRCEMPSPPSISILAVPRSPSLSLWRLPVGVGWCSVEPHAARPAHSSIASSRIIRGMRSWRLAMRTADAPAATPNRPFLGRPLEARLSQPTAAPSSPTLTTRPRPATIMTAPGDWRDLQ